MLHLMPSETSAYTSDPNAVSLITGASHPDPFSFLGLHDNPAGPGLVLRVFRPEASQVAVQLPDGSEMEMLRIDPAGFFEAVFREATDRFDYRLLFQFGETRHGPVRDPYAFGPVLGDHDLHYLGEGTHRKLWKAFGAQIREFGGAKGTAFSVWAPNAHRVSIVGDFNSWDGRVHPMRNRNGVWEIFLPGVGAGEHYKFEIVGADGNLFIKSDPLAFFSQHGPQTASITYELDRYRWNDDEWMERRAAADVYHAPMSVYAGRLRQGDGLHPHRAAAGQPSTPSTAPGATRCGLLRAHQPLRHARRLHVFRRPLPPERHRRHPRLGAGPLPQGRPRAAALRRHRPLRARRPAQGRAPGLGHADLQLRPQRGAQLPDRQRPLLVGRYHIDGLRVDAVASMLYLDYSREEGEWMPNEYGGRENLEAIEFLKDLNELGHAPPGYPDDRRGIHRLPGVSRPTYDRRAGLRLKWNMGWMNDTLSYIQHDPVHRKYHHDEADLLPDLRLPRELHPAAPPTTRWSTAKAPCSDKMPGDMWQQFANLRLEAVGKLGVTSGKSFCWLARRDEEAVRAP
jgi:1,4-alpha-glucan branching enzyme